MDAVSAADRRRILLVLSVVCFTAAMSTRAVDPLIPQIASEFWIAPEAAALIGAAFAAYGLVQPVLGPVADAVGKMRVMTVCVSVLALGSFGCAVATSFPMLVGLRILVGAACGGSFPVAMAIVADLVPVEQRQVTIGRLLAATISGNLLGAAIVGVVTDVIHWRVAFLILGVIGLIALALSVWGLRKVPPTPPQPLDVPTVVRRFRTIFANPVARTCYLSVGLEGVFLFGVFPYIAVLLAAAGEPRAAIAGLVIAAFAIGGMVYSASVGWMLVVLGQKRVMIGGGLLAGLALALLALSPPWQVQALLFAMEGCGFYMLHASIQVYVTELAPASRSSAVSFHTFSLFVGQGLGPVVFGLGLASIGVSWTLVGCGIVMAAIGIVAANRLVRPAGR